MAADIHFETPENIRVSYRAAGPGTRFVAWVVDNILLWILTFLVAIPVLLFFGAAIGILFENVAPDMEKDKPFRALVFVLGIFWLIFSLGGFLYFGLCELFWRGQTLGKRQMRIRVVKSDGFSLDPLSVLVRTLFRVVDHLPPLWIVPVFTERSQRLGDLVAGTVVVADEQPEFSGIRELADRKYADCKYHFDVTTLARARRQDVDAVERILERWSSLGEAHRDSLLDRVIGPLAARLQVDSPPPEDRRMFLEDFLSAEYRRQYRKLG